MRSYKIHLIRHGFTEANLRGEYVGCRTDLPLTAAAKKELHALSEDFEYPHVALVFSSPLLRCTETAKILFPGKEVIPVENMREYDFGDFEGKTAAELDGRPDYTAWAAGHMPSPPNGETSRAFTERVCVGLNEIINRMMAEEETEAVAIMHGGAIMMLLAACGLPQRNMVEWTSENGKGYTIQVTPSLYQRTGAVEVIGTVPLTE